MFKKNSFIAPLWILGIIFLLTTVVLVTTIRMYVSLISIGHSTHDARAYFAGIMRAGASWVILLIDWILYWRFRHWIKIKSIAWVHIIIMLVALVVVPGFFIIQANYAGLTLTTREAISRRELLIFVRNILFGALMILAHVFFVALIRHAGKEKAKALEEPDADSQDILDDYAA